MLTKPEDYTHWNREFMAKANALDLWDYVKPESRTPWPTKPSKPELRNYPKRLTTTRSTRTTSSITVGEEEEDTQSSPSSTLEMTKDGKEAYTLDWNRYTFELREYENHRKRVNEMNTWLLETVSTDYKRTIFNPSDSIYKWYERLREIGQYLGPVQKLQAKAEYTIYMKEMSKLSRDLGAWVTKWETIVALALEYGVTELKDSNTLMMDLQICFGQVLEAWITTFKGVNRTAILNNTLTYREIGAALRDEASSRLLTHRPARRTNRGAFGANFHGQSAEDFDVDPPAGQGSDPPATDRAQRGRGRGRARSQGRGNSHSASGGQRKRPRHDSNTHESGMLVCKGCFGFHSLPDCWYIFPEDAPEDFTPSSVKVQLIQRMMELDSTLKEAIQRIKNGKKKKKIELESTS